MDVDRLKSWKLVEAFRSRVLPQLAKVPLAPSEEDPRRALQAIDYFGAFLMAVFNPVITSARALAELSRCDRMRQVTAAPFAASSFSAAQHLT